LIDSLDYLCRGKEVHEYLSLLLDFKPVFTTENGKVNLLVRAGNKNEVLETFIELAGKAKRGAGIMYSGLKKDADKLHKEIKPKTDIPDLIIKTEISAVPSVYFGPKSLGLAIL
ncbi:MAG: DegV family protein, partial [Candidatus Margulisiibacteriota bacterium]